MSDFFIISHRGNIFGPNPDKENQPKYLSEALNLGFNIEIDVWLINNIFYLGHDKPQYAVNERFFENDKVWVHCKNIAALNCLILNSEVNCFAHDNDDYVVTTKKYIWCYPKMQILTSKSIAVLPERVPAWNLSNCAGICTDYITKYEKILK